MDRAELTRLAAIRGVVENEIKEYGRGAEVAPAKHITRDTIVWLLDKIDELRPKVQGVRNEL